ncbi:MAG TPA: thiamine pyrophosphate-dependent enzyme [Methanofastidiosum sp.]|nr:thiamine pyrophosphate-dependent enzyme [Methanofastidiosum sp.]
MNRAGIPIEEYVCSGHSACPGCGALLVLRYVLKVLGKNTIVTSPACCFTAVAGMFPDTCMGVPLLYNAFETTAASASGIEAALKIKGKKDNTYVVAFAGDGGTADIGLQAISGALEDGHNIIYVCYDNEAYMNTGIQSSSLTPMGATTTTNPIGKEAGWKITPKKNMIDILVAHNIKYAATVNPSYPIDFVKKVEKAKATKGFSYIHAYSVCPTGWRYQPELGLEMGRLATETGAFPLYEVENGKYNITYKKKTKNVLEYYKLQGRFRHLSEDFINDVQVYIDQEWQKLLLKEECSKK